MGRLPTMGGNQKASGEKRKKIKDKNNKQIRGKAGVGKKRAAGRRVKAAAKSASYFVKVYPQGQDPEEAKKKAQTSYVKLAKEQEEKAEAGTESGKQADGTECFERSHLHEQGATGRQKTVNLDGGTTAQDASTGTSSSATAQALRTGCAVTVVGIQSAPELNGKQGKCLRWDAEKKRWLVSLPDGQEKLLKPENLKGRVQAQAPTPKNGLAPGAIVKIQGLQGAPELNGKHATIDVWDAAKKRWKVRLADGEEKLLKPENLKALPQKELQV